MNKKLLILPTVMLSSALLLTGCNFGNDKGSGSPVETSPSSSSSSSNSSNPDGAEEAPTLDGTYVAPPAELDDKYKGFFMAPMSTNADGWTYYDSIGATTYKEDASTRSTTMEDWSKARSDSDLSKFDKMYGEVTSDVEQSALNISAYLEKNPSASVDDIKDSKDLIINRYSNAGTTTVEKDSKKGFYFVIFNLNDDKSGGYGILVPQKGITPDFDTPPAS